MRHRSTLVATLWVCLSAYGLGHQTHPNKIITLTPDQIPLHAIWRNAFGLLTDAKQKGLGKPLLLGADGNYTPLALNDKEMVILVNEASLQAKRDEACLTRQQHVMHRLTEGGNKPANYGNSEILIVQIECRQETLDAGARVAQALSEDGRAALDAWFVEMRQNMKVEIHENELEHYRRPR
jgi:hypothetical protein